jgi:hypothetical protein
MQQLALILPTPTARRRDPSTSKDAARKATTFANHHRDRIHAALATPGNIYEIAKRSGLDHVAVARRLPELMKMGLAEPTEERREGCRVWRRIG